MWFFFVSINRVSIKKNGLMRILNSVNFRLEVGLKMIRRNERFRNRFDFMRALTLQITLIAMMLDFMICHYHSIFGRSAMAIEEPDYTVETKGANYEIRSYGPILVAETKVEADFENAGNQAFRILAGYIFGANQSKTKIAMTAPVNQESASEKIAMTAPVTQLKGPSGFLVQFTMPKKYTIETLPKPIDSRVQLRQLPERKVAVYRYSGSWSEARYSEKLASFRAELNSDGIVTCGEPVLARYNSPFQIWFLRRNEIWIEVEVSMTPI